MHLAVGTKAHAFILWAENYKLNLECYKVRALQFIPNHVEVTGKIVARVMWALVYGMMGERNPVPDRIVGLEGTGPHEQSPAGAAFPRGRRNRTTCESVQGMDGSGLRPGLNTGSMPSRRPGVPASFMAATPES